MKPIDELLNTIAANHGVELPANAKMIPAPKAKRKLRREDDETLSQTDTAVDAQEQHAQDAAGAPAGEPMLLAQADTGTQSDAAGSGSGSASTPGAAAAAAGSLSSGLLGAIALGGLALAGGGGGSGGGSSIIEDSLVSGTLSMGPTLASNGLKVQIYAADGTTKLGETTLKTDGSFTVNIGRYKGAVIARVVDANDGTDYMDEATGAGKDLNANLMAVGISNGGRLTLNLNPLTTIAAQKAGLAADGSGSITSTSAVTDANTKVAEAFGLGRIGNPKCIPGVSLTPGAAVDRRFRAGVRHDSEKRRSEWHHRHELPHDERRLVMISHLPAPTRRYADRTRSQDQAGRTHPTADRCQPVPPRRPPPTTVAHALGRCAVPGDSPIWSRIFFTVPASLMKAMIRI